jgi:hypothetical protein
VLLPDLRLISDLSFSRLDDPFAGRDRDSWSWRETLEMRPTPRWNISGSFNYSLYETLEGESLFNRTQYRVLTTWQATNYLTLGGTWWYTDADGSSSLNQSYNLSYAPGPKLTVSAAYQGFESAGGRGTFTDNVHVSYRVLTRFVLFANLSRSRSEEAGGEIAKITNLRGGFRLSF